MLRILFCLTWNLSMGQLDLEETRLSCRSAGGSSEEGGSAWACKQGIKWANIKRFSWVQFESRGF